MNKFHPLLKFKANYDFDLKIVEFLDTVISIDSEGYIKTTLFTKPGKKCTYLSPNSCHPRHVTENIPYSLALRLKRICSYHGDFLLELSKLKDLLLSRGYRIKSIENSFSKVIDMDRRLALQKKVKKKVDRVALPLPFDPRLPHVSSIVYRFWKVMTQNPRLKKIFPNPPMVCWSRPKNIRDHLIRANLAKELNRRSLRVKTGFLHCNRNCIVCCHSSRFCDVISSSNSSYSAKITSSINCLTTNVIYCITCQKCNEHQQYIGETGRRLCDRFLEHRGSVNNANTTKTVGLHYQEQGHSTSDMQIVAFEHLRSSDPWIRKVREKFYIKKFDPILNRLA